MLPQTVLQPSRLTWVEELDSLKSRALSWSKNVQWREENSLLFLIWHNLMTAQSSCEKGKLHFSYWPHSGLQRASLSALTPDHRLISGLAAPRHPVTPLSCSVKLKLSNPLSKCSAHSATHTDHVLKASLCVKLHTCSCHNIQLKGIGKANTDTEYYMCCQWTINVAV